MEKVLYSLENDCRSCYKCIRHCPVKSISFKDGQASIIADECILCGNCYLVCPQGCKKIRDDADRAFEMMKRGNCYASVAPSYLSAFPSTSFPKLREALIKLGFADAEETALGATQVKREYDRLVDSSSSDVIISTCCHAVNLLIERHHPSLASFLAPVLSPMQAHAKMLKAAHPGCTVVFLGPCIAKKDEVDRYDGYDDLALTFLELKRMLKDKGIEVGQDDDITLAKSKARLFPTEGGILATMDRLSKKYDYLAVSGMDEVLSAIEDIEKGKIHHAFVEMSSCRGSCLNGPALGGRPSLASLLRTRHSAGKEDFDVETPDPESLRKDFHPEPEKARPHSEEEITRVLNAIGKYSPKDELNCSSCGYATCREKAIAVLDGKASLEMCLPYLSEKASSFGNDIVENTPNGIIVCSDDLTVQLINPSLCQLLGVSASSCVGKSVEEILDPSLFALCLAGESVRNRHIHLEKYDLYVEASLVHDERYHIIIGTIRDRTQTHLEHEKQVRDAKATAEITKDVIEKNLRAVQEIAQLLGESAANTKIALTNLAKTIDPDNGKR